MSHDWTANGGSCVPWSDLMKHTQLERELSFAGPCLLATIFRPADAAMSVRSVL